MNTRHLRDIVSSVIAKMDFTGYTHPSDPFPTFGADMADFNLVQGQTLTLNLTLSQVGTTTILFTKPDGSTETKTVDVTAVVEPVAVVGDVAL